MGIRPVASGERRVGSGVPMADPREVDTSFSVFAWYTFCGDVGTSMGTPDATSHPETGVSVTTYIHRGPLETQGLHR